MKSRSLALVLALGACSNLGPPAKPAPPPFALQIDPPRGGVTFLPKQLEARRAQVARVVYRAVDDVALFFRRHGVVIDPAQLIDRVIVLGDRAAVVAELGRRFQLAPAQVPATFAGTVHEKTLLLVTPELYAQYYRKLYPGYRWSPAAYTQLVEHELSHRAHALWAKQRHGSEDAMGPRWFYEGLACVAAGQFAAPQRYLEVATFGATIAADTASKKPLSYPRYAGLLRSLLASFPLRYLLDRARGADFVARLTRDYLPTQHVFERGRGRSRGSLLLLHGSAPFNADGRIPGAGQQVRYAQDPFYADLSSALRRAGWDVLRYHKPGVSWAGVNRAIYATTDRALLERQLRNLWRFLPASRPRIAFAWSEGSLHLRALPLAEVDAVVLLGGIATNIGDVIASQGGPSAAALRRQLAGQARETMLGRDRPVGRLLDELDLPPTWKLFAARPQLPLLILHGTADREVPVAQASVWRRRLSGKQVTVRLLAGRDHRLMLAGRYDVALLGRELTSWLDRLPTRVAGTR